jgi:uncharacterized ferritin-like protein (DUF455 family)
MRTNLRGRDLDIDRRIIFERILNEEVGRVCTGFKWYRIGSSEGFL